MRTLIFSHLYQRPGTAPEPPASLREMVDMWLDHLRGPGNYRGDVILFTNVETFDHPELILRPFPNVPADPLRAHLHRALSYRLVPVHDYDVAMQMDLDLLAVDDINPLFPRDTRLWAAPSTATALDYRHAWTLLPLWRRRAYKLFGWRMNEPGVSACVVASAAATWEQNFGAWAQLIRAHGDRKIPRLADQGFLNLLYFTRRVPMSRWPFAAIRHSDWDTATGARLLHFPCAQRVHMSRYRRVPARRAAANDRGSFDGSRERAAAHEPASNEPALGLSGTIRLATGLLPLLTLLG
ncbi:MAG TPA: hypothetical protein VFJ02_07790 [Vicinamibacterales bacterium]|nr:hypothetical protein [Vicinamibacterales bacterium]